jgi:hypothetical protein
MQHEFDLISDLHKDARGFRPSSSWLAAFRASTRAEQQAEWDSLIEEMEDSQKAEAEAQAKATDVFEARVADLIASGARDRATAIRWIADAEDVDLANDPQGWDFLAYLLNLPYQYLNKEAA